MKSGVVRAHGVNHLGLHRGRVVCSVRAVILRLATDMLSIVIRAFALTRFQSKFEHFLFVSILLLLHHSCNLVIWVLDSELVDLALSFVFQRVIPVLVVTT